MGHPRGLYMWSLTSYLMSLITAADAIAALNAAGHRAMKSPARSRVGCQTLCYLVDGQYVNLGRLRQLAREVLSPKAAAAEPAAVAQLGFATFNPETEGWGEELPADCYPPDQQAAARAKAQAQAAPIVAAIETAVETAPYPIRHNCTSEPARGPLLPGEPGHPPAPVAQGPGPELPTLATPAPTGDAWAGQPWDPGTPEARARVALQGERVATLWPVALALRGAGVTLPGSWATDGPVLSGEWSYDRALAALPLGAIAAAAAALAALPPVTRAQARALELCRGQALTP